MKTLLSLLLLLWVQFAIQAQKFGDVSNAELQLTRHPLDSTAYASYLWHEAQVVFDMDTPHGIMMEITRRDKIKIFEEKGKSLANFAVVLYHNGSDKESISNIKASTFNEVNGKKDEIKLDKKDIYKEEIDENRTVTKFALPDVRAGSVIDVEYKITTPYIYTIPTFYFQGEVPMDHVEYHVQLPEYFTYTPIPHGTIALNREEKTMRLGTRDERKTTFSSDHIPAIKEEEYVLNMADYTSSLKYELYSFQAIGRPTDYYSKNWVEIGDNLLDANYFGKEIKRRVKDLDEVLDQAKNLDKAEKIRYLYSYVQNNYSWNGDYGKGTDEGLKNLLKVKSGNIGEINLLLLNLLNKVDIPALPFILKSRYSGLLNAAFPSSTDMNYVMAYIPEDDGSFMLLDASSKYVPMGQLPKRATNVMGLLVTEKGSRIVEFNNPNLYKSSAMNQYTLNTDDVVIEGTGKRKYSDYAATLYRIKADEKDDEEDVKEERVIDEEEDEVEDVNVNNISNITNVTGFENIYDDIVVEYEDQLYENVQKIGDKYFVDATLDFGIDHNPFTEAKRDFPVFYDNLVNISSVAAIDLPEGYNIESSPATISISLEERSAKFSYEVKQNGNKCMIYYKFQINKDIFGPNEYENLKEFYNVVMKKQDEKIVIAKNNP